MTIGSHTQNSDLTKAGGQAPMTPTGRAAPGLNTACRMVLTACVMLAPAALADVGGLAFDFVPRDTILSLPLNFDGTDTRFTGRFDTTGSAADVFVNAVTVDQPDLFFGELGFFTQQRLFPFGGNAYELGTPIAPDTVIDFSSAVFGSRGPVFGFVSPGVVDFELQILGGADREANDVIASVPLQLEVVDSLDIAVDFEVSPAEILAGETVDVLATLTNNNSDRDAFINNRFFINSPFAEGYGSLTFDSFSAFPEPLDPVAPGASETIVHTTWASDDRTVPGVYRSDTTVPGSFGPAEFGLSGGLYAGDTHDLTSEAATRVKVLPAGPEVTVTVDPGESLAGVSVGRENFAAILREAFPEIRRTLEMSAVDLSPFLDPVEPGVTPFLAPSAVDISGINGEVFLLELFLDESEAGQILDELGEPFLIWEASPGNWIDAVLGNSIGEPSYLRNVNPLLEGITATEAFLGRNGYYFDELTQGLRVWAVLDHNSRFAVGVIPEPTMAGLIASFGGYLLLRPRVSGLRLRP